jgi:hypothetical protein
VRNFTERGGPTSAFPYFYGGCDGIDWRRHHCIGCIGMGDVYHYSANDRFWHDTDMAGMPQFIDPHRDTRTECLRSSSANKGAER